MCEQRRTDTVSNIVTDTSSSCQSDPHRQTSALMREFSRGRPQSCLRSNINLLSSIASLSFQPQTHSHHPFLCSSSLLHYFHYRVSSRLLPSEPKLQGPLPDCGARHEGTYLNTPVHNTHKLVRIHIKHIHGMYTYMNTPTGVLHIYQFWAAKPARLIKRSGSYVLLLTLAPVVVPISMFGRSFVGEFAKTLWTDLVPGTLLTSTGDDQLASLDDTEQNHAGYHHRTRYLEVLSREQLFAVGWAWVICGYTDGLAASCNVCAISLLHSLSHHPHGLASCGMMCSLAQLRPVFWLPMVYLIRFVATHGLAEKSVCLALRPTALSPIVLLSHTLSF
jgi:hypothetical protein